MSGPLRACDYEMFAALRIPRELVEEAGVVRVTDREAREEFGFRGNGDLSGIVFQYFDPSTLLNGRRRWYARLRLDFPEDGRKYLGPFSDRKHLFAIAPDDGETPIVLVEAEKSVFSLDAWSKRTGRKIYPLGLGGCWGWRGKIGIKETPRGERVPEKGSLPDLHMCAGREVFVMLDPNVATNHFVRKAQRELVAVLLAMQARVRICLVPCIEGVNGPDDRIGVMGDAAITALLEEAPLPAELAMSDAEASIAAVEGDKDNTSLWRSAMDAIAALQNKLDREKLEGRLAELIRGKVSKQTVTNEVREREREAERKAEAAKQELEQAELMRRRLDLPRLIDHLENFFAERGHLPEGGALMLAYFTLNCYCFGVFDTTPYICLESATPRCGKSTLMRLLGAVCARSRNAAAMNEAPLFRVIAEESPTMLIDEAEALEGNADRAKSLRTILNEGYKKGAQVPRCFGEDNQVRWYGIYCPKAFAAIGGVTGPLLDRCIVLHMERLPAGKRLRSSRLRILQRDAGVLIPDLKAYAAQNGAGIQSLYDTEPDEGYWPELFDREAELWGPLLTHARIVGKEAEQKLLDVVRLFVNSKAAIEAEDSHVARAIAVLEALEALPGEEFSPADIIAPLEESEAWASSFSKVKGTDDKARRKQITAKIGYFLRSFRLKSVRRRTGKVYDRQAAIDVLRAHVPENQSQPCTHSQADHAPMEVIENTSIVDGVNGVHGFTDTCPDGDIEPKNHAHAEQKLGWVERSQCPGCGGMFGAEFLEDHLRDCRPYLNRQGDVA